MSKSANNNDNLNKTDCIAFLREYNEFKKNKVTFITNPKTKRQLSNKDRIENIKNN